MPVASLSPAFHHHLCFRLTSNQHAGGRKGTTQRALPREAGERVADQHLRLFQQEGGWVLPATTLG
jgi:hypothetical protein